MYFSKRAGNCQVDQQIIAIFQVLDDTVHSLSQQIQWNPFLKGQGINQTNTNRGKRLNATQSHSKPLTCHGHGFTQFKLLDNCGLRLI